MVKCVLQNFLSISFSSFSHSSPVFFTFRFCFRIIDCELEIQTAFSTPLESINEKWEKVWSEEDQQLGPCFSTRIDATVCVLTAENHSHSYSCIRVFSWRWKSLQQSCLSRHHVCTRSLPHPNKLNCVTEMRTNERTHHLMSSSVKRGTRYPPSTKVAFSPLRLEKMARIHSTRTCDEAQ